MSAVSAHNMGRMRQIFESVRPADRDLPALMLEEGCSLEEAREKAREICDKYPLDDEFLEQSYWKTLQFFEMRIREVLFAIKAEELEKQIPCDACWGRFTIAVWYDQGTDLREAMAILQGLSGKIDEEIIKAMPAFSSSSTVNRLMELRERVLDVKWEALKTFKDHFGSLVRESIPVAAIVDWRFQSERTSLKIARQFRFSPPGIESSGSVDKV